MKYKFIKSTIILLLGGFITKILGMLIKILMSRIIGLEGLSLYMLVLPVFSLFISLGQIGLPIALSRMVSLDNIDNHKLYFTIIPFVIVFNTILSLIIILLSSFISNNLFHNEELYLPIVAIGLVIPFTSISGVCRSYFFGKERMFPHVVSNIVEDIVRLLLVVFVLPKVLYLDIKYIVFFIIIFNIISEAISSLVLIFFLPNKKNINICNYSIQKSYLFDALKLAIPNVSSNLLGNIVYFLEPIILTNILLYMGYSSKYISFEYGVITGYVIPLILLPSFFTSAISQSMLPFITREYNKGNIETVKRRIYFILFILFIFGSLLCIFFLLFGRRLLSLIYNTNLGYNYLRIIAPFCILQYLESPMMMSLNALGEAKRIFYLSIFNALVRVGSLIILSLFHIGIYSFIFSLIINIFFTTLLTFCALRSSLNK